MTLLSMEIGCPFATTHLRPRTIVPTYALRDPVCDRPAHHAGRTAAQARLRYNPRCDRQATPRPRSPDEIGDFAVLDLGESIQTPSRRRCVVASRVQRRPVRATSMVCLPVGGGRGREMRA